MIEQQRKHKKFEGERWNTKCVREVLPYRGVKKTSQNTPLPVRVTYW